jgi:hypothetical protein
MEFCRIFSLLTILVSITYSTVINVPQDVDSIQDAINLAVNDDTVLIDIGEYYENIIVEDKEITIGSKFLTTGDTSYISKTIINGDSIARVINIKSKITLSGLTITNGYSDFGAGIKCESGSNLNNLVIKDNVAYQSGGGLHIERESPKVENVIISNNIASHYGGGIRLRSSNSTLRNMIIKNNMSRIGGGIYLSERDRSHLSDMVVKNNYASGSGGGLSIEFCIPTFNYENRISVFYNRSPVGSDMVIWNSDHLDIALDTITIIPLRDNVLYVSSPDQSTISVLNSKLSEISSDVYVDPMGSDSSSGITSRDPFKTIFHALIVIAPDSTHPLTIYLNKGEYSYSNNGEIFPINLLPYVSIEGVNREEVILNRENNDDALNIIGLKNIYLQNFTLKNVKSNAIRCRESELTISALRIQNSQLASSFVDSKVNIDKTLIAKNNSFADVIYCTNSDINFSNCTFSGNSGTNCFNLINDSNISLINSILWNQTVREILLQNNFTGSIQLAHTNIKNGEQGIK